MVTPLAVVRARHGQQKPFAARQLRRVAIIWALLFFNVLGAEKGILIPFPHTVGQILTQGALVVAFILALTVNPKVRIRPNWFLGLYSTLAITSFMMSMRLVSLGTAYRGVRLVGFIVVLWLLTPWWGRRDAVLLRAQMRFLMIILGSVLVGLIIAPGKAMPGHRLSGALWPIPATQVAHYAAELTALTILLWMCGMVGRRRTLLLLIPSFAMLLLAHTRTALFAMLAGLTVGGLSLLFSKRRVRKTFTTIILVALAVGLPASSFIASWVTRGESHKEFLSLSGRTNAWNMVLSNPARSKTSQIFGMGLSNDAVIGLPNPASDGLSIDSSWVSIYQDQGIVGDVLIGAVFLLLILIAVTRARGPARAIALFLIVYCLLAGTSETGVGAASQYTLDLALVASLLIPPSATDFDIRDGLASSPEDVPTPVGVR